MIPNPEVFDVSTENFMSLACALTCIFPGILFIFFVFRQKITNGSCSTVESSNFAKLTKFDYFVLFFFVLQGFFCSFFPSS